MAEKESKVVPPPASEKPQVIKKMEPEEVTPQPKEADAPATVFGDEDIFRHLVELLTQKIKQSRKAKFGEITFSFFEVETIARLLGAAADRTKQINAYFNQRKNNDLALLGKLQPMVPALEIAVGDLKQIVNFLSVQNPEKKDG